MFELKTTSGKARYGILSTPRGNIETPFFMNVATAAAIKGGITAPELSDIKCKVMLCNTYHLHLRPGDELIRDMGGLHRFTRWDGPILTDSGGFQVFSLSSLRRIKEEGVYFSSHIDGRKIFMGPEESMQIQHNLGANIAMAFDECIPANSDRDYVTKSVERTSRWLHRCKAKLDSIGSSNSLPHPPPMLFGINQGGVFTDIRKNHMDEIAALDLPGYAIGGLAVGESKEDMLNVIEAVEPIATVNKPRYLMGVGTPSDIIEAVYRGIDMFDCVMPTRNARHGTIFTKKGILHVNNSRFMRDDMPLDTKCSCPVCKSFSRSYIRHLFKAREYLGGRLACIHNLYFYNNLMEEIKSSIKADTFESFRKLNSEMLSRHYTGE